MSASTSAGSADSRCPLPRGTRYGRRPVHLGTQSSRPARGEVNVIEGGRRMAGNSGQPGRRSPVGPLRSWQDRATRQLQSSLRHHPQSRNCVRLCLSATYVDDSEPDPHDAAWRGRLLGTTSRQAARCLGTNRRTPCCCQPPDKREARLTTCASYPPIGLEGWAASDPDSPLTGSARPFTISPAHRTNGRTAVTTVAHRFHLPCAICRAAACFLDDYTCSGCGLLGNPAAEDKGVLQ